VIRTDLFGGLLDEYQRAVMPNRICAPHRFALLGTAVGIFTIVIGVGPRTALDLTLHGALIVLLVTGLVAIGRRAPVSNRPRANAD